MVTKTYLPIYLCDSSDSYDSYDSYDSSDYRVTAIAGNTRMQALPSYYCQKSASAIVFYPVACSGNTLVNQAEMHSLGLNGWTDAVCPIMQFLTIAKC